MTTATTNLDPRPGALWAAAWRHIPERIARTLAAGGGALEVGCGSGLACLALAEAFPAARIVGHDESAEVVARAQELARIAGLQARVRFAAVDSTRLPRAAYHLITAQALRARCREPQHVLNAIRNALVREGACLLIEPPTPSAPAGELEALARAGFSRFRPLASDPQLALYELRR